MLRKSWIDLSVIPKWEEWLTKDKNGGTVWGRPCEADTLATAMGPSSIQKIL